MFSSFHPLKFLSLRIYLKTFRLEISSSYIFFLSWNMEAGTLAVNYFTEHTRYTHTFSAKKARKQNGKKIHMKLRIYLTSPRNVICSMKRKLTYQEKVFHAHFFFFVSLSAEQNFFFGAHCSHLPSVSEAN